IKLGQPSGPAPLKRWLETLSARDGDKPPDPTASDPSIAVSLGSLDLELEEVAAPTPAAQDVAATHYAATANNMPSRAASPAALGGRAARAAARAERAAASGVAARFGRCGGPRAGRRGRTLPRSGRS